MPTSNYDNYSTYIRQILKIVHEDTGINGEAMMVVNDILSHTLVLIKRTAAELARLGGTKTVNSRDIQSAVRMILPGLLNQHAARQGVAAVTRFNSNPAKGDKSARAGVIVSIGRVARHLKKNLDMRVSGDAPVYMAAVLQYVVAELLELAGNVARNQKKVRITPRHIALALMNDRELEKLYNKVVIASGGVLPNIAAALLPRKKKRVKRRRKQMGGAAGAKRHRRILRDNIYGVTNPAIKRLARKAGIKRVGGLLYESVRGIIKMHLNELVRKAVLAMENERVKTLKARHVHYALQNMDRFMAGLGYGKQMINLTGGAKKRKFKPGTVALREIRRLQKTTDLQLAKEPFRRLIKETMQEHVDDARLGAKATHLLQSEVENYVVDLLKKAHQIALHSGRITVSPKDLQLADRID